jgi:hypothetical protein
MHILIKREYFENSTTKIFLMNILMFFILKILEQLSNSNLRLNQFIRYY